MTRHKEITAHIRSRIKAAGIKARVRMSPSAGAFGLYAVQIFTADYTSKFTAEEIEQIAFICKCNKLTGVRGEEIDVALQSKLTGKAQFDFFLPA